MKSAYLRYRLFTTTTGLHIAPTTMPERVDMLRKCLTALAAEADEQLHSLRQDGCVPPERYIDELALDYDAIAAGARNMLRLGELTSPACECVEDLDRYLASISGAQNAHLWTADALR